MTLTIKIKETKNFVVNHKFAILITALAVTTTTAVLTSKQNKVYHDVFQNLDTIIETVYANTNK